MVISAMWRRFSVERITCVSNVPRIFWIFSSPPSTCLRVIGVISYWRPVYSTFIDSLLNWVQLRVVCRVLGSYSPVTGGFFNVCPESAGSDVASLPDLALSPPLMRTWYLHVFPIFRHRTTRHLDSLRLQDARDLVVSQWMCRIFLFNQFLNAPFQDQQRCPGALRPLHAFREEVAQLKHALRRMNIFAGHSAADRGRMH